MGLFDWMKGKRAEPAQGKSASVDVATASLKLVPPSAPVQAPAPAALQGAVQESDQSAGGLDFASAIQAHRNWKNRLGKYLSDESDEKLNYRVICRDDQCVLGKWINGEASDKFGNLPSFGELKVTHGMFHLAAGRIVQLHDENKSVEAMRHLRQGDYPRHSIKVMGLLSALYGEVEQSGTAR